MCRLRAIPAIAALATRSRGGYLRSPKKRGEPYRLVKDTGPRAPQILHFKQLFDANTGKIMTGQTLEEALDAAEGAA